MKNDLTPDDLAAGFVVCLIIIVFLIIRKLILPSSGESERSYPGYSGRWEMTRRTRTSYDGGGGADPVWWGTDRPSGGAEAPKSPTYFERLEARAQNTSYNTQAPRSGESEREIPFGIPRHSPIHPEPENEPAPTYHRSTDYELRHGGHSRESDVMNTGPFKAWADKHSDDLDNLAKYNNK